MILPRCRLAGVLALRSTRRSSSSSSSSSSAAALDLDRVPGVTMVRSPAEGLRVADVVRKLSRAPPYGSGGGEPFVHAWDTEVVDLDLDVQSPVGHGRVICASFYSGPDVDYGTGPRVWIDNLAQPGTLQAFRGVLEDPAVRKVWHNYGFDRHVLKNHGIDARGFFGDTMHMARLCDTSLKKSGGYSLHALSNNRDLLDGAHEAKQPLMELFGRPKKKKNGEDSKVKVLPPLGEVQQSADPEVRRRWVEYSSLDAEVTWRLYQALRRKLSDPRRFRWEPAAVCFDDIQFDGLNALDPANAGRRDTELLPPVALELYERVVMPFGELLTDLERNGVVIDVARIEQAGVKAAAQRQEVIRRFKAWAVDFTGRPDMAHFNVHSDMQKAQLLFGLPRKPPSAAAAALAPGPAAEDAAHSAARTPTERADELHEDGDEDESDEIDLIPGAAAAAAVEVVSASSRKGGKRKRADDDSLHPLARSPITPPTAEQQRPPAAASASTALSSPAAKKSGRKAASLPSIMDPDAPGGGGMENLPVPVRVSPRGGGGSGGEGGFGRPGRSNSRMAPLISEVQQLPPWLRVWAQRHFSSAASGGFGSGGGGGGSSAAVAVRRSRRGRVEEYGSDLEFVPGGSWLSSDSESNGSDLDQDEGGDDALATALAGGGGAGSGDEGESMTASAWASRSYFPAPLPGLTLEPLVEFDAENTDGFVPPGAKPGTKPKKKRPFFVPSLFLPVMEKTLKGRASGSAGSVKKLVGKPIEQGPAFRKLVADGCVPDVARHVCERINDLLEISQIDTTIETFIEPLMVAGLEQIDDAIATTIAAAPAPSSSSETTPAPDAAATAPTAKSASGGGESAGAGGGALGPASLVAAHAAAKAAGTVASRLELADSLGIVPEPRVHCSLNLNTETGRLSARRPNMQNQPSLDRDRFRIRSAFVAPTGRKLIVADYGQLELRVLAHLAGCASMVAAFRAGGDFHSRTAMGMYPFVREAVEAGEVLLEWDEERLGAPPKPLLKDAFKEERRKAKVLNFSIAYGKTAYGLAKDWAISHAEAERTVELWYGDRPEVQSWQERTKEQARRTKRVYTILGRHRDLPDINTRLLKNHNERAAINTPIQGSAADIVMCAMLKIWRSDEVARLGFRMLLQVHDEVILEGPAEHAARAMQRVVELMGRPFDRPLLVDLVVDAKVVQAWGDAK